MCIDDDEFFLDDDEFSKSANINKITKAYEGIFKQISDEANEGEKASSSGDAKGIVNNIDKIIKKISAIIEISKLDNKIVGPTGVVFNVFGKELENSKEDSRNVMTEDELIKKIELITKSEHQITFDENVEQFNELTNDNAECKSSDQKNNDLNDIDW